MISEEMRAGSFYEIDHAMLAPITKFPDQLKLVRVVMVSEKTGVSVSLRFPSIYSLRNHFNCSSSHRFREGAKKFPPLDEKYVMSSDLACQLLQRQVSASEFAEKKDSWSFWAVNPSCSPTDSITATSPPHPPPPPHHQHNRVAASVGMNTLLSRKGTCWSALNCGEMLRWGKRRQVRFLSRHEETDYYLNLQPQSVGCSDRRVLKDVIERGKEVEVDSGGDREESGKGVAVYARDERLKEEEEGDVEEQTDAEEDDEEEDDEQKQGEWTPQPASTSRGPQSRRRSSRKPKLCGTNRAMKINRAKRDIAKKQVVSHASKKKQKMIKASIDRWSAERYKLAEQNMLRILKDKGAVYGNPILRPALRLEARKLIGDTGLLDHLLKHMSGKVAPGGIERFRRRHNADGAMEYWLESADLMNIRKEAGIQDPYWTPPAGWKPGDSPSQDPVCAKEIKFLMKEIANLKEEMQHLVSKKQEESLTFVTFKPSDREENGLSLSMQEMFTELLRKKTAMEEQLKEISEYLSMMRENMELFNTNAEDKNTTDLEEPITPVGTEAGGERMKAEEDKKEAAAGDVVAVAGALLIGEPQGDKVEENLKMTGTKTAAAAAEDRASRIQRLKSGFRICKPQGTFLWPDMGVSSSPSPQFAVEGLLVVPSLSTIPSYSDLHLRHHHQTSNGGGRATEDTLVINLNELPNITDGSSLSMTYKRRHQSTAAISSLGTEEAARQQLEEDDDDDGAGMNQMLKKQKMMHQQFCSSPSPKPSPCVSVGASPTWLALATSQDSAE
ncbi:hypothetical protein SAY87_005064 [Trapa incisa]|uniref:PTC1-like winged helix-turn-helix domain-containing protein n=1 Tax=Trapa incisa TaxID=236973 RepID=A0AAN7JR24_9MYRT|nr:hypothetical protein SAY87_005064 [Trapa incisa]